MEIWQLILGILASLSPVLELRGGIPLMLGFGFSIFVAFVIAVIANILIVPVIFLFLDTLHKNFMGFKFYRSLFENHLNKARYRFDKGRFSSWPYLALLLFVAIPFPTTGVYTGSLLAWFFEFNKRKSFISITGGVIISGILVSLVSLGVINLF